MEEVIYMLNKYHPYLSIKKLNLDNENNYDSSSDTLSDNQKDIYTINGKWYPSFYLFKSNGDIKVLGGVIQNGQAKMDGTSASPNPTNILNWVNSEFSVSNPETNNNNNTNTKNNYENNITNNIPGYVDYSYRLNMLR